MSKLLGWKSLPAGDVLKAGTAKEFETGDWRSSKPLFIPETCIHCLQCFIYCPDSAVNVEGGKMKGFDYKYCKGCGICVKVCPTKPEPSIKMAPERE